MLQFEFLGTYTFKATRSDSLRSIGVQLIVGDN